MILPKRVYNVILSLCGFVEGHGKFCAVFAKLIVKGKNEGIHVFIVPIRNADGSVTESVNSTHFF
jgi:hypothetical protein